DLILSTVLVALLVTTFFVAPSSNPFRALSSLLEPASSFPEWLLSTLASCAGAICFFALSIVALRVVRAKAKGKNRG
ncbi:MAG TPA: hypothetical protein VL354_19755, partial [Spirochaetia bacterium]|nr:hypothetical protein [Spirochaetia bacterium]